MRTRTINSRLYAAGTRILDIPPSVQKKFTRLEVICTRESWSAGGSYTILDGTTISNVALAIKFERTLDNGTSWQPWAEATFPGGDIFLPTHLGGGLQTTSSYAATFYQNGEPVAQDGDTRLVFINPIQIRTEVTINAYDPGDILAVTV